MSTELEHTPLPRVITTDPDTRTIELGHQRKHLAVATRWLSDACALTGTHSFPLQDALELLHDNALRHTASGLPGGSVRITLTRLPFAHRLAVTDNGPTPGAPLTFPVAGNAPGSRGGLHRLTETSLFWEWEGSAGGPLTVWAVFDQPTTHRR